MAKSQFFLLPLFFASVFGIPSGHSATLGTDMLRDVLYADRNAPNHDTPLKLKELWLQFHESDLCQELDAEFVFSKNKMEVWVRSKNENSYEKLTRLLEPLKNSGQIELHTERPSARKELADVRTPPPSFWENSELTAYLRDPFLPQTPLFDLRLPSNLPIPALANMRQKHLSSAGDTMSFGSASSPIMYEQRLLMFARDTLEYSTKMNRYAADLPSLARVAFDPTEEPALRHRALAICREHAQELQKYEKKLNNNLLKALPKTSRRRQKTTPVEQTEMTKVSPFDIAVLLAGEAQALSNGVYRFMYPQDYTVTIADLRNPPFIRSLATIREITAEFRNIIS
jgi:hypothetical protein